MLFCIQLVLFLRDFFGRLFIVWLLILTFGLLCSKNTPNISVLLHLLRKALWSKILTVLYVTTKNMYLVIIRYVMLNTPLRSFVNYTVQTFWVCGYIFCHLFYHSKVLLKIVLQLWICLFLLVCLFIFAPYVLKLCY